VPLTVITWASTSKVVVASDHRAAHKRAQQDVVPGEELRLAGLQPVLFLLGLG